MPGRKHQVSFEDLKEYVCDTIIASDSPGRNGKTLSVNIKPSESNRAVYFVMKDNKLMFETDDFKDAINEYNKL